MSVALRVLLLIGAVAMFMFVIKSIRKSRIQMKDALVWMIIAVLIAIFGILPSIPVWIAWAIGIESAANMVFLIFIAILLICIFSLALRVSMLEDKITTLTGEVAIRTQKDDNIEKDLSKKITEDHEDE